MEQSPTPPAPARSDAQPRVPQSGARLRLASLHGPAPTPPSAPGSFDSDSRPARGHAPQVSPTAPGIPLSEAIAAQYFARRPWWRRMATAVGERVPPTLRGRWGVDFRAAVALGCLAVVGAAGGGWYLWRSQATVVELPSVGSTRAGTPDPVSLASTHPVDHAAASGGDIESLGAVGGPAPSSVLPTVATATATATGVVVVDVEGKVTRPGVETLPPGSRVHEAIRAAGGVTAGADTTGLDLARPLIDGEQLRVGLPGAPQPPAGVAPSPGPAAAHGKRAKTSQPVNLNTATPDELQTVPTIGPAMAQRIIDWRTQHGRFTTVAQLRQVRGIGDRKFAELKDSVTV